jgi:hypothetical protein
MGQRAVTRRQAAMATACSILTGVTRLSAGPNAGGSTDVRTSRLPSGAIQPQLVLDDQKTLHLLYYSGDPFAGDLFYVQSKDQAATWSPAIPVNAPGSAVAAGTIRGAQMAVGRNGRVHVAWNGSGKAKPGGPVNPDSGKPGAPMLYTRLNDSGTAFEPQRNLMKDSFGLDGGGSVAADKAGNVFVTWHGIGLQEAQGELQGEARRQVRIVASHDDGTSFSQEKKSWTEPTGACGCCGMKSFVDGRGNLLTMYRSARESIHRDIYLLRSSDRGEKFRGKLLHKWDINACPMSSMDFAESALGVVAAWETGSQVYWTTFDSELNSKTEPVPAPGEGKARKHPRLAVNKKGELLLVWTEGTGWQRGGSLAWQCYNPAGQPTGARGTLPGVPTWSFAAPIAHPDGSFTIYY